MKIIKTGTLEVSDGAGVDFQGFPDTNGMNPRNLLKGKPAREKINKIDDGRVFTTNFDDVKDTLYLPEIVTAEERDAIIRDNYKVDIWYISEVGLQNYTDYFRDMDIDYELPYGQMTKDGQRLDEKEIARLRNKIKLKEIRTEKVDKK